MYFFQQEIQYVLDVLGKPDAVTNCSVDNRTITAVLISCQVLLHLHQSGNIGVIVYRLINPKLLEYVIPPATVL